MKCIVSAYRTYTSVGDNEVTITTTDGKYHSTCEITLEVLMEKLQGPWPEDTNIPD